MKIKTKEKKDIFNDNKEILKKNSPKMLLFLIKNTPKDCYMIKDEIVQSEEKIGITERHMFFESEEKPLQGQIRLLERLENSEDKHNET